MSIVSLSALPALACSLAPHLTIGDVILLSGEMGAGKTTFAAQLIRALAGDDNLSVTSPTYTLVQHYTTPRGEVWHYDLHRLSDPRDLEELALEEALENAIILIEWPEIALPWLTKGYLRLDFVTTDVQDAREITASAVGAGERLIRHVC